MLTSIERPDGSSDRGEKEMILYHPLYYYHGFLYFMKFIFFDQVYGVSWLILLGVIIVIEVS